MTEDGLLYHIITAEVGHAQFSEFSEGMLPCRRRHAMAIHESHPESRLECCSDLKPCHDILSQGSTIVL